MPRVSVLVPTYGRPGLLLETLGSVRAQTFADFECVVADDGSSPPAAEGVAPLASTDPRFRVLTLPHSGSHGRVRNAALAASSGPLVAFLDDDDVWLPDALAGAVAALDAEPDVALVFGQVERFGEGSGLFPRRVPTRPTLARLLEGNPIPCSTVVARREALESAGPFREDLAITDYAMWLAVRRRAPIRGLDRVQARYRVHAGAMSARRDLEAAELTRLYDELEREWQLPRRVLAPGRRGVHRLRARLAPDLASALPHWVRSVTGARARRP